MLDALLLGVLVAEGAPVVGFAVVVVAAHLPAAYPAEQQPPKHVGALGGHDGLRAGDPHVRGHDRLDLVEGLHVDERLVGDLR